MQKDDDEIFTHLHDRPSGVSMPLGYIVFQDKADLGDHRGLKSQHVDTVAALLDTVVNTTYDETKRTL